ncbi:putative bifunctional diguanylate cyclase/phosphodiesterase [Paramesorhizobium deserti]|nr:bifunctional diguanylate cyclase/phosphodiesterase [Paramesorhizobium deserti]
MPNPRRFFLKTGLPIILAAIAAGFAFYALLVWSSQQTDRVSIIRQERLVALVVSEMRTAIAHDQESVTVWDDAVNAVRSRASPEWIENNLGTWMHSYFGHDGAYILDPQDRPIYAFSGDSVVAPSTYEGIAPNAAPLVATLRAKLRISDKTDVAEKILTPGAADLSVIDGHPALVSVKPIVSDTGKIEQVPGSEYLHIAVRFLDGGFIEKLARDYLFEGLRFSWNDDHAAQEASYALDSASGRTIGYFIWEPYRPGSSVLASILPILAALLVTILIIIAVLIAILHRRSAKLQISEARLHHLALHDPLTGLPNRTLFNARLDQALDRLQRGKNMLAVLYLDLYRFKQVTDMLGHPAGDELIREFTDRLKKLTRDTDTVARIGGDEFAIVAADVTRKDINGLCERIIDTVRHPFDLYGNQIFLGISIGVTFAPTDGLERTELTRKADIALYHAKSAGRSRYAVFGKEMDTMLQARRGIEQDLRAALQADDQLQVHYQPIYSAAGRKITGAEALLRWRHPEKGWIAPDIFIPIAEEAGLIERLGERVLREACTRAMAWPITVAVNVSAIELRNPAYAKRVAKLFFSLGMDARRLELEMTESALTDNSGQCEENVKALREMGIRIAIDDFGTGFSSLSRLQRLDVDRIKIDRSFVKGFGTGNGDEAIVQAIVELARATALKTTAEGVETDAQATCLEEMGCDNLQGYLLSPPRPASEIDDLLGINPSSRSVEDVITTL